jgi:hypothetical protein
MTLKEELLEVKGSTSTDSQFRRRESQASVKAIWREYKHKEHQLEIRLKELEDKLHTENVVNNETKEFLARKVTYLADKVAEWESKYDTEIADIDGTISIVSLKRTNLLEKLSMLQERRQNDLAAEEAEREAERLRQADIKEQKAQLKKQNRAARTLQRELRAFTKRKKELEAIKGDGKKKGKGGKGGDKKKGKK